MFDTLHMRRAAFVGTIALASLTCASASAAVGSNPVTFTNTTLAGNAAADVSTVVVNNDTGGQITVQVNFARPLTGTDSATVLIDADQNPATGDPQLGGAEYLFSDDEKTNTWDLEQWQGTGWVQTAMHATVRVTGGSGTSQLTFSVNRNEIGVTTGFNFWVDSMSGAGGPGYEAQAPASTWNYQLQAVGAQSTAVRLSVVTTVAPATVKAGGVYTVGMVVQRSDTAAFLGAEGTVQCVATLRGRRLPAPVGTFVTVSYQGVKVSGPVCAWRIPTGTRGATLRGTMTVSYQGAQVQRAFSARIG